MQITQKGKTINTVGNLPKVGSTSPDFALTKNDLSQASLEQYKGKRKIVSIFPSIDTGTCAMSVRKFNEKAGQLKNTVVLNVSMDLPFAQKRFCGAEGIQNVETLSAFRSPSFGKDWGVTITEGTMTGLFSRAVVVLDENNKVVYTEQVPEIGSEPDYDKALRTIH